jgi:hypothetical protein
MRWQVGSVDPSQGADNRWPMLNLLADALQDADGEGSEPVVCDPVSHGVESVLAMRCDSIPQVDAVSRVGFSRLV